MRLTFLSVALAALAASGCGGGPAKVKGRLVSDGQPVSISGQVGITFTALDGGSEKGGPKSFTQSVSEDGSFEVVVSGGELPPGNYQVSFVAVGPAARQFKHAAMLGDKSPVRRELKPGPNEVVVDVAKPEG